MFTRRHEHVYTTHKKNYIFILSHFVYRVVFFYASRAHSRGKNRTVFNGDTYFLQRLLYYRLRPPCITRGVLLLPAEVY